MRAMMRLAGASYAFIFVLYLLLIATGLALYTVIADRLRRFKSSASWCRCSAACSMRG